MNWGQEIAEAYDAIYAAMFDPEVLDPTVELLAEFAREVSALAFAVGTGRMALPLRARGVPVHLTFRASSRSFLTDAGVGLEFL
ncbi:MAG: hypothetical protein ACYDAQ_17150 [Mycobacteriales bacterium]